MPPPNLAPLDPAACPLLTKYGGPDGARLVERFNAAAAEARRVADDKVIGPLLATARFAGAFQLLERVRRLLGRDKYVVGCIGITQAGKSTTVNNVLGEEVCKPGAMDATSSLPCRITKASRRSLDAEWLTPKLLAERRQKLCEAIGLATPGDDRDLLPLLDQPERFRQPDGTEPPRLRDDLRYLKELLVAAQRDRGVLADPPRVQTGLPYDRRYDYTTHGRDTGEDARLLREARFHLDNPQLPDDLELCDLPGLDSKRTVDDVVTWEYLPGLQGVFLFVNASGNLLTEGMLKILARLKAEFRDRVGGRAWVIFNKMDGLTPDAFRAGDANVFVTIARFLDKVGVPESQVCLASKRIWDAAASAGGAADPAAVAAITGLPAGALTPDVCPPGMRAAWGEALKDGGVSRLRHLMFHEVAGRLAAELREDAGRLVAEFEAEFAARVAAERKRATMSTAELLAPDTCYTSLLILRSELATKAGAFPVLLGEMARVRQALEQLFDTQATPERLASLSRQELAGQFATHARVLDAILDGELSGELLERVYDEVGRQLDGLPAVPVGPTRQGCREAWRHYALEDRTEPAWLAARARFASGELADWLSNPAAAGLDGEGYVALMRDKIDAGVRQTAHILRARLRHRLGQLAREVSLLAGRPDADAS